MYGYSSYGSDLFSLLGFAGGIWLSLTFIAFVAAIVYTVLLYRKYVSSFDKNQLKNAKHDFGPFLRFENFGPKRSSLFCLFTTCVLLPSGALQRL